VDECKPCHRVAPVPAVHDPRRARQETEPCTQFTYSFFHGTLTRHIRDFLVCAWRFPLASSRRRHCVLCPAPSPRVVVFLLLLLLRRAAPSPVLHLGCIDTHFGWETRVLWRGPCLEVLLARQEVDVQRAVLLLLCGDGRLGGRDDAVVAWLGCGGRHVSSLVNCLVSCRRARQCWTPERVFPKAAAAIPAATARVLGERGRAGSVANTTPSKGKGIRGGAGMWAIGKLRIHFSLVLACQSVTDCGRKLVWWFPPRRAFGERGAPGGGANETPPTRRRGCKMCVNAGTRVKVLSICHERPSNVKGVSADRSGYSR